MILRIIALLYVASDNADASRHQNETNSGTDRKGRRIRLLSLLVPDG